MNWRAGPSSKEFSDDYFQTRSATGGIRAFQPLAPVHLRQKRQPNGDIIFQWIRRGRIDADSWMGEDIPLGEVAEKYQVELWNGQELLQKTDVVQPSFSYTNIMQQNDLSQSGDELRLQVAQISQAIGKGMVAVLQFKL